MRVIYGLYDSWLTPEFYCERGKAYDPDESHVAIAYAKRPEAFGSDFTDADNLSDDAVIRRGPGRPRNV